MRVVFKSYSRPTLQATKHGFFYCPTKPSTQARSTSEWRSCRLFQEGMHYMPLVSVLGGSLYCPLHPFLIPTSFPLFNSHSPLHHSQLSTTRLLPSLSPFPRHNQLVCQVFSAQKMERKVGEPEYLFRNFFIHTSVWNVSTLYVCGS